MRAKVRTNFPLPNDLISIVFSPVNNLVSIVVK